MRNCKDRREDYVFEDNIPAIMVYIVTISMYKKQNHISNLFQKQLYEIKREKNVFVN